MDSNQSESSGDMFSTVRKRAQTLEHSITRDQIILPRKTKREIQIENMDNLDSQAYLEAIKASLIKKLKE